MKRWYVVNTKLRQEGNAEAQLQNQGFTAWLPSFRKTRSHARRVDTVKAPLFTGYLFVELDLSKDSWSAVNGTWGVKHLLSQNGKPVPLPEGFVEDLKSRTDDDGTIILAEPTMKPGQKFRIMDGPFEDCIGTLQHLSGKDRVAILLNIFNKPVVTTAPRHMVMAI
ncbi:transcriptional activator RfaH [uncultured Pseudodesulfovibrio sp.]|uniref:transcription termination/antitermination protein NusG n=1 Tax=uncultured Pseudodesulfovibrio sp. TaxID=2035858 RepID=UPI0029C789E6|nr:transcriptional activator RfaH [uncultured Pseudodesulfovibrio sp.]